MNHQRLHCSLHRLYLLSIWLLVGCLAVPLWADGAGGPVTCPVCEQQLSIKEYEFDEPLIVEPSHWSETYTFGGLEPEFDCTDGTYHELNFQPSPEYDYDPLSWCSFSPWPDPYNTGLNPYEGPCGQVAEEQVELALTFSGEWNHVEITDDQVVSVPVNYQSMRRVLLGNADDVEWRYACDLWFNPSISYTVHDGVSGGHVNTNSFSGIQVPRFPRLCQNPRFEVRAPAGTSARVYSIKLNRRICDPSDGEPVSQ